MSARQLIICKICNKRGIKSERGLIQHQATNRLCRELAKQIDVQLREGNAQLNNNVFELDTVMESLDDIVDLDHNMEQDGNDFMPLPDDTCADVDTSPMHFLDVLAASAQNVDTPMHNNVAEDNTNQLQTTPDRVPPCTKAIERFRKYAAYASQHFLPLQPDFVNAINLMHTLRRKKATLDTYDEVMEWHFRATGQLQPHETMKNAKGWLCCKKIMSYLAKRYNVDPKLYYEKPLVLPSCKAKVNIIWHHARDCVASLLTDPWFVDDDFVFFENNPFAPPPDELNYISDINTGKCYLDTYHELIKHPNKQILVPILLYIDGAVAGQFQKLKIEALRITIGILKRTTRDKEHAWRTLGYVPNYNKEGSRSKKMFLESGHDAAAHLQMEDEEEGAQDDQNVHEAQDWHEILSTLLESYGQIKKKGMLWDFRYRGKVHKDCELVFFLAFLKVDNEEADKCCTKYSSRGKGVKQLCRYCECPNEETDNIDANYPLKTVDKIKSLVDQNRVENLKALSQQHVNNAFHEHRFGMRRQGVHGSCPIELLHLLLLGIFLCVRNCFFGQIGPDSVSAAEINALAKLYGGLFTRQSDRDLPKTNFAKGIQKGKIMAKEFSGILLNVAAILQSPDGRALLAGARSNNFDEDALDDWTLLVETLLEWEAYLKLDKMEVYHVQRLKKKHRVIMYLLKKVANRTKGMGMKIMKFHGILHIAFDILNFGVPMCVDTGSNESHHKLAKMAAKLTQKDIRFFEGQTAQRLVEFLLLDLAMEELNGNTLWEYFVEYVETDSEGELQSDEELPNTLDTNRVQKNRIMSKCKRFTQAGHRFGCKIT
ncbi:MAG: hypothetical protein KJO73_12330 [Croceitalea sp.]|nr:hypothetical protein [Croceitalea sp.]